MPQISFPPTRRAALHGASFPPPANSSMDVGINTSWLTSWAGALPFANILANMNLWQRQTGAAVFTQDQGYLTIVSGGSSTDTYRAYVSDAGDNMPTGTYTLLNPAGLNIGVGPFSGPSYVGYTTATSVTFNFTGNTGNGIFLWYQGATGVSGASGNLQLILPNCLASYQAGNPWNPSYLAYHSTLGEKQIRFMDAMNGNGSIETDWADRCLPGKISFLRNTTNSVIPHEMVIDLANRLGINPWVIVPARATTDYMTQMAALYAAGLNTNIRVKPEFGNELWNYATAFSDHNSWMPYRNFTKYTAVATHSSDCYTLASHGLTSGTKLFLFNTKENFGTSTNYLAQQGSDSLVEVVDANTIQLRSPYASFTGYISGTTLTVTAMGAAYKGGATSVYLNMTIAGAGITLGTKVLTQLTVATGSAALTLGTYQVSVTNSAGTSSAPIPINGIIGVPSDQVNVLYVNSVESGKTANAALNIGTALLSIWDAFDGAFASVGGISRIEHIVGGWALDLQGNPSTGGWGGAILNVAGVRARTDAVHYAPYFNGVMWLGKAVPAAGSLTPSVWASVNASVVASLYLASATPTTAAILAGTGAISTQTISVTTQNGYTAGTTITGLTDGTSYKLCLAYTDSTSAWTIIGTVLSGTSATSPQVLYEAYTGQATRARLSTNGSAIYCANAVATLAPIKVNIYECGYDFYAGYGFPAEQAIYVTNFLASQPAADALKHHFYSFASAGVNSANQYSDSLGKASVYSLTPSGFTDTTSPRFSSMASLAGSARNHGLMHTATISGIPLTARSSFPSLLTNDIVSAPALPYTVAVLPSGYTYSVIGGDLVGNYAMTGNLLQMISTTGINFSGSPQSRRIYVEASNGYSSALQVINFVEGFSWHASDAIYGLNTTALSSVNTSIAAETGFGSALALTSTAHGVLAGGLIDMTGAVYAGSGMTAAIDTTLPLMIAQVLDRNNQALAYASFVQIAGGGSFMQMGLGGTTPQPCFNGYFTNANAFNALNFLTMPTASYVSGAVHVHWVFFDPVNNQILSGYDQNVYQTLTGVSMPVGSLYQGITVGAGAYQTTGQSSNKHGSLEILSRSGLTLGNSSTTGSVLALVKKMQVLHGIN